MWLDEMRTTGYQAPRRSRWAPGLPTRAQPLAWSRVGVIGRNGMRSEEHTSELQSQSNLVCRLLLEKKKQTHSGWGAWREGSLDQLTDPRIADQSFIDSSR